MARIDEGAETLAAPLESASILPPDGQRIVLANRYEIIAMLGAGAMGNVYRARDVQLDETVALKMLKRELADDDEMLERFKREVKLARRVTHRNVARTFDIGEHENDRFLTMEYVEGEMLGARLERLGRLEVSETIAIGRELCLGLAAAHSANVVHRDLKPENVIKANDGRVVITDFGIARAFDADLARTMAGGLVGTPAYMSPEQVEGRQDVDARSDLYSLGLILYELLTGKLPWEASSAIALAAARLIKPPPDPRTHVPSLPADLVSVVTKLLARAREERFPDASAVDAALAEVAARLTGELPAAAVSEEIARTAPRSIAVLPLSNQATADDDYLAEATVEDLVDLLTVVPGLRVRARGETARVAAKERDAREVGRALGVDVVVDGSMRRVGSDVRIALRLVTVSDGFQLWAHRYVVPSTAVLGVADEAATAISKALDVERSVARGPTMADRDPAVEELYLRGRRRLNGWFGTGDDFIAHLREAHALAPDDPRIAGALAFGMARFVTFVRAQPNTHTETRALAERALALDPTQPEARCALGLLHLTHNEGAGAIVELKKSLMHAPNNVYTLDALGRLLGEVGRPREGMDLLRRALAIDPEAMRVRFSLARLGALVGEPDLFNERAGSLPKQAIELVPYFLGRIRHIISYRELDEIPVVRAQLAEVTLPGHFATLVQGYLRLAEGKSTAEEYRQLGGADFDIKNAPSARRGAFNAQLMAEAAMSLGEPEPALEALVLGDEHGILDIVWFDHAPILDAIRNEPRFQSVRRTTAARAHRVLAAYDDAG